MSSQQAHLKNLEQKKVLSGSFSFRKSQWQTAKPAVSWIQEPSTHIANSYCRKKDINMSEEVVHRYKTSCTVPCKFLYAVPLLLTPLQGIPNPLFLKVSFTRFDASLVFHARLLHKVSESWFFMTLLNNCGEKSTVQHYFSTHSTCVTEES